MSESIKPSKPLGELSLKVIAMPADTNWNGDVFGGWLVSQMDLAGAVHAHQVSKGRVATISINNMVFHVRVKVGQVLGCYTQVVKLGNTSMQIMVEVWESNDCENPVLVTNGVFTYVAIDDEGKKRPLPQQAN
jgi:acyl-CoA thioesterase YciA